jgi:DNA-binding transcriptional MerR regulator
LDNPVDRLQDYLTIKKASEFLGVSSATLRHWDRAGKLVALRHPLNGYRLYREEELLGLLEQVATGTRRVGRQHPVAGGVLQCTPSDTGSAYVVVVHLSPEHESRLAELLSRSTALPVRQVTGPVKVESGHVYVIPPGKHLEMDDGTLRLREPEPEPGGTRVAVDTFFRTLAEAHGPQAAAVVLSGTGVDGTLGIRRVKEGAVWR